jgi:DNA-binding transcriptional MerR regulator
MGFTIKELETLSGIKAHTIRIWEQRYHFLKPSRTSTNIRTYSNEELKTLLTVALLNKYGYKISRIDTMSSEQRAKEIMQLQSSEAQVEHLVNELVGCMIELNIAGFEKILNEYISENGIEKTITSLVFLFLEKVGILWQTNRINPAHEHIVTNIVRQKIIHAIEILPLTQADSNPLFVLFLPEEEFHELGLLFVYYLLRKQNIPVIYLGANVPLKDAQYVINIKNPSYVYIHLVGMPYRFNFQKFLTNLSVKCPLAQIIISGEITAHYKKALPANVSFLQSLSSVLSYIHKL